MKKIKYGIITKTVLQYRALRYEKEESDMAEILGIDQTSVKLGDNNGSVSRVPIAYINYPNPKIGDKVNIYKDGNGFVITKLGGSTINSSSEKSINKHFFVWVCNFLFGALGVDRFVRGQIGMGIFKLLCNWMTCGIWALVDWIIAITKAYGSAYGGEDEITFTVGGAYTK